MGELAALFYGSLLVSIAAFVVGVVLISRRGAPATVVGVLLTFSGAGFIGSLASDVVADAQQDDRLTRLETAEEAGVFDGPTLANRCVSFDDGPPNEACLRAAEVVREVHDAIGEMWVVDGVEIEGRDDGSAHAPVVFVKEDDLVGWIAGNLVDAFEKDGWTWTNPPPCPVAPDHYSAAVVCGSAAQLRDVNTGMTVELRGPAGESATVIFAPTEPNARTTIVVDARITVARRA